MPSDTHQWNILIEDIITCEDYTNQTECENAGCYWYDNSCHTDPMPVPDAIGYINFVDSVFFTGPLAPGQQQIGNCFYGNSGTEPGEIYFFLFEYPNTTQENMIFSQATYMVANQENQMLMYATIPDNPGGTYPVGVKVWGEAENEPMWGTTGTYIWGGGQTRIIA